MFAFDVLVFVDTTELFTKVPIVATELFKFVMFAFELVILVIVALLINAFAEVIPVLVLIVPTEIFVIFIFVDVILVIFADPVEIFVIVPLTINALDIVEFVETIFVVVIFVLSKFVINALGVVIPVLVLRVPELIFVVISEPIELVVDTLFDTVMLVKIAFVLFSVPTLEFVIFALTVWNDPFTSKL